MKSVVSKLTVRKSFTAFLHFYTNTLNETISGSFRHICQQQFKLDFSFRSTRRQSNLARKCEFESRMVAKSAEFLKVVDKVLFIPEQSTTTHRLARNVS